MIILTPNRIHQEALNSYRGNCIKRGMFFAHIVNAVLHLKRDNVLTVVRYYRNICVSMGVGTCVCTGLVFTLGPAWRNCLRYNQRLRERTRLNHRNHVIGQTLLQRVARRVHGR